MLSGVVGLFFHGLPARLYFDSTQIFSLWDLWLFMRRRQSQSEKNWNVFAPRREWAIANAAQINYGV